MHLRYKKIPYLICCQLLSDLLIDNADTTEMESTIELNLMAVKLKHTVKRIKNNNKTEDKSEI